MQLTVQGRPVSAYTGGVAFDPARPCTVFLHGALHDHSGFTLLARWLAHHGQSVLAVDEPGHGGSAGPPLPSVEALADWVLQLLDAAGLAADAPVALVGHSMGALIALEAAARAPERVRQLVLIGATYPMAVSAALLETARSQPQQAIEMVNRLSIGGWASKPAFPGPGMWLHGSNRVLMQRTLARAGSAGTPGAANLFEHDFRLCDAYRGGDAAAARVRCPVTMVTGRLDQMTPERSVRQLATALQARRVSLDCGHLHMAEAPDGVLAAVREALGI